MGLFKGNWSFTRLLIEGNIPERKVIDERLKKYAFLDLDGRRAPKTCGWTSLEDILDTNFTYANYNYDDYLVFSLRVDRRSVPPSLLKIKLLEREKALLAEKGRKALYRHEREEVREAVFADLLGKTLAAPSFYDVCWCLSKDYLLFGSLSPRVQEDFEQLFKESFHLALSPYLPWNRVGRARNIEKTRGEKEDGVVINEDESGNLTESISWGREFLTWLWFKSEEGNGVISIPALGDLELVFLSRIALATGQGEYSEKVVCQGWHSDMREGKEALRLGKKITEASLRLSQEETSWEFTLKADLFQLQSLKSPSLATDDGKEIDKAGRNLERIYLLEKLLELLDQLFSFFMALRLSAAWQKEELPRLAKWLMSSP